MFLISRWTVQKLKINYLAKSIQENTEVVEKEEEINVLREEFGVQELVESERFKRYSINN